MLYPLKFSPILKDKIWGGTKLKTLFNKPATSDHLGESWELSGYEGDESVVTNGFLAGNNLAELLEVYMGDLVGDRVFERYGHTFPLLFKLIDANDNLSIQVHPNDETARARHDSLGKTEMWYVVDADPGAELIIGFAHDSSKEEYSQAVERGEVERLLQHVPVQRGDVFFIPAGLVHAIGRGVVVAEIQESSDITYRIYDYKRKDADGHERELHVAQALDVIDFAASPRPKTPYEPRLNEPVTLVSCDYFTTNSLRFDREVVRDYAPIDSFVTYMCLEGAFDIVCEGEKTPVQRGETVLVPAAINEVKLVPSQPSALLEVYVQAK